MAKLLYPAIIRRSPELLARAKKCKTQGGIDRIAQRAAEKKGKDYPGKFTATKHGQTSNTRIREEWYGVKWDKRKTPPARHMSYESF